MEEKVENGVDMELGKVNAAFENDSEQRDTDNNFSLYNGVPTATVADEKRNLDGDVTAVGDEESGPQRQQWSNGTEFVMSCIAMAVGLGNIWRFPFIAYNNGGGAFLIPYIIVLFVIGKPLYYLEVCIGQFVSGGPVKVWALSPALKGIGYGQMFATVMVLSYYCSIMAVAAFYLVQSFADQLPWSTCFEEWVDICFDSVMKEEDSSDNKNLTGLQSSSELFFYRYVLNEPESIEDGIGDPDWRLTIGLFVFWVTVFVVVVRGVQSSGKAAYFLALFPYVVMITLLIRGATLPGSGEGVEFFFTPQWEKLQDFEVWYNAVTQAFFSLNICFGTLIMYSSYSAFEHNVYWSAMIVTTVDTFTSLLAGCTVFSILGNLAYEMDADISSVVKGGPGLAFVSYPEAIAKFDDVPQLFAVLFFLMLYVLGLGSAVALLGAVITVVRDSFPKLKYLLVAVVACVLGFIAGLVYITPGGQYILNLVDHYGANFPVFILGTAEIVGLAWVYGVNNICDDLEFMLGIKTGIYWRICWSFITPVLMIVILVYSLVNMEPIEHNDQLYPTEAYVAGWILFAFGVAQLPLWALIVMYKKRGGSILENIQSSFGRSELWRPQNNAKYKEYKDFKERKRIELEIIKREEKLWQKIVRTLTGYSSIRNQVVESSKAEERF